MGAPANQMQQMMNPTPGPRLADDGEWVALPESEDADIYDTEDGGADIVLEKEGKQAPTADDETFYDNLCDSLPEGYLDDLAVDLMDKIERDKKARSKRDEQYAEGLKRTGIGKEAPGGAEFEGASKTVHPMLTKSSVEYAARAMKEIFPAQGPAKTAIPGTATRERIAKANRLKRYYNWLMTMRMVEFRPILEQTLTQSALGGVQYIRYRWSQGLRRPTANGISEDQLFLPYDAPSLWAAERVTYQDDITEAEYTTRVNEGIYRDVEIVAPSMRPDETRSQEARAKAEGKDYDVFNTDGTRRTYEVSLYLDDCEDQLDNSPVDKDARDGRKLPYLVFLDETTKRIAGLVRNWEKDDTRFERMQWIVEWPFIPWTGAMAIGLIHCIGSLASGATGSLRALMDAGFISNFQTVYALKGANVSGQSQQVKPTQMNYIKGGVGGDDIRKLLFPINPQQPSQTLLALLQFLCEEAEGFVQTTFESLQENNPNAPVGTTYAQIEQGLVVVSSIIGRAHFSMFNSLGVLQRICRMYVTDEEIKDEAGEILAYRADFQGPSDVVPVSDPGIPSDAHRMAQMQTVAQRADMKPMVYNQRKVEKMILERLRVEDPEQYLMPMAEPEEMNAANENAAASFGKPIVAFPHQDHLAHIQTHMDYMNNPFLGSMILLAPKVLPPMMDHLSQHVALWYLGRVYHVVKMALHDELEKYMEITDDVVKAEIDRTIAAASKQVAQEAQQAFAGLPQAIQQAQQLMKQIMPPPPVDPGQVQQQKNQADAQAKGQQLQQSGQKMQIDAQNKKQDIQARMQEAGLRLVDSREQRQADAQAGQTQQANENQRNAASSQADAALAAMHEMSQNAREEDSNQVKMDINTADNDTAIEISRAEIAAGKHSPLSNGRGIGRDNK